MLAKRMMFRKLPMGSFRYSNKRLFSTALRRAKVDGSVIARDADIRISDGYQQIIEFRPRVIQIERGANALFIHAGEASDKSRPPD